MLYRTFFIAIIVIVHQYFTLSSIFGWLFGFYFRTHLFPNVSQKDDGTRTGEIHYLYFQWELTTLFIIILVFFILCRQEILYQYYAYAFHGSAVSWRARFYYIYSIPSKCPICIIYHTCSLQQDGITFSEWLEKTLTKSTRIHALH